MRASIVTVWLAVSLTIVLSASGVTTASARPRDTVASPATEPSAGARALRPALLTRALDAAAELPRLRSLLVARRGETLVERYFNGARADRATNVKSASKSVMSALVGIAIHRGVIDGIDQTVADIFPEHVDGATDPARASITIEDLLTMRSGLETTSNRNYGAWVLSRNWVRHVLTRKLEASPGGAMRYSTGNTHLLSAAISRLSGASTWEFAQRHLAEPLGFDLARWPRDPQGIYFGGNDMLMTPRQMLTFGMLYLRGGRWAGRQVVPADWVETSLEPRTTSRWSGREYGYGWWIRELGGHHAFYAWGYGGQFIFVVPALDMVVVTTSSVAPGRDRRTHLRAIFDVVSNLIVPAANYADRPLPTVDRWHR